MNFIKGPLTISESYIHRTFSQRKRRGKTNAKTNAWHNRHRKAKRQARRMNG